MEALDERLALRLRRAAVEELRFAVEFLSNHRNEQVAHLAVLREDKRAVAGRNHFFQHFHQAHRLTRTRGEFVARREFWQWYLVVVGTLSQEVRGVIADLLQLHERRKHKAATLHAVGVVDAVEHVVDDRIVELRLLRSERHVLPRLDEWRKIADDGWIGLQAAQHKRAHEILESIGLAAIFVSLDRCRETSAEIALRSEIARRAELENRPEFAETILDGRTRECNAMTRAQRTDRRSLLRWRILDVLRFVEHHAAPMHAPEAVLVAHDKRVRRDDDVCGERCFHELLALRALESVVNVYDEFGRETMQFAVPVADDRHRANKKRRTNHAALRLLPFVLQERDELHGLTKTHVVREAAAEAEAIEEREPRQTLLLIRAQRALESLGLIDLRVALVAFEAEQFTDPALRVEAEDREPRVRTIETVAEANRLHHGHLSAWMFLQEAHRAVEVIRTNLNPLAVHAQERRTLSSKSLELLDRKRLVAERDLPRVVDEAVKPELAAFAVGAGATARRKRTVA